ncbi:MAG: hypothetical protein WB495_14530 [Xanthobacteraceae bacterium]
MSDDVVTGTCQPREAANVTRFKVRREFLSRYPIQQAGGQQFQEYWIPADHLAEFNSNIVDIIEIAREFRREEKAP